jgi:hypothetical protein
MTNQNDAVQAETEAGTDELESLKAQKAAKPKYPPVKISGTAHKQLASKWRSWSGWRDARIEFSDDIHMDDGMSKTDIAFTDMTTHVCHVNGAALVRNPNRVLATVNPFRLKPEAVMTGVLLHEAGHARFSLWLPVTEEAAEGWAHGDGSAITEKEVGFARLMEEARVEGKIGKMVDKIDAKGLDWTMRAAAAHLLPMTKVSDNDAQAVMDVIGSWVKRAGRLKALGQTAVWVNNFDNFLAETINEWLTAEQIRGQVTGGQPIDPDADTDLIVQYLNAMIMCQDDTGPTMIDYAKNVLDLLYRNQDDDQRPDPNSGMCAALAGDEASGEGDGEQGDGDADGNSVAQLVIQTLEQSSEQEAQQALADGTDPANQAPTDDAPAQSGAGGGAGRGKPSHQPKWRNPTPAERELQRGAERFLRSLIAPTETTKVSLSDSPSAMVDPVAYSAWKAGGMVRSPHFFKRVKRTVDAAPPVKIAILVDISGSMDVLQEPSAVLSWALSAAALDLSNFAGRGQQIEACMIHWGDSVKVVQEVGQYAPGISTAPCREGTSAMHGAMKMIEEQIPDFYIPSERANRLIVQFTDWELDYYTVGKSEEMVLAAMASGINMLTVAPYSHKHALGEYEKKMALGFYPGDSSFIVYDKRSPGRVWEQAAAALMDVH